MTRLVKRLGCRIRAMTVDELLVCAAAAAILLPDIVAGVIVAGIGASALVRPRSLGKLAAMPVFRVLVALLPLLVVPPMFTRNYNGILIGAALWLMLVFMLYAGSVMTVQLFSNLLDLLLVISGIAALYGIYCQWRKILELGRVGSIFENPNYWGFAIELFVLMALCQYLRKGKPIYLIALAANLLCNILCDCRSAWVCILAGVTVFGLMYLRKPWLLGVGAGASAGFFALTRFVPDIGERLTAEAVLRSLSNRRVYWSNAWSWFLERPLFGWGPQGYLLLSRQRGERVLAHAHSMYLNVLLDTGVVGTVLTVVMICVVLRGLLRRSASKDIKCLRCLVTASCAAAMLHGLTDMPLLGVSTAIVFFLIISGMFISAPETKNT